MWDCLVNFSTWVEGNSGQIQIVIAVVALILAILGYKQVLEQMHNAANLEKLANEQRKFELRLQLIQFLEGNSSQISLLDQKLKRLQKHSQQLLEKLNDTTPPPTELKEKLQIAYSKFDELNVTLNKIANNIKSSSILIVDAKNPKNSELEDILILVSAKASATSKIDAELNSSENSLNIISSIINK